MRYEHDAAIITYDADKRRWTGYYYDDNIHTVDWLEFDNTARKWTEIDAPQMRKFRCEFRYAVGVFTTETDEFINTETVIFFSNGHYDIVSAEYENYRLEDELDRLSRR